MRNDLLEAYLEMTSIGGDVADRTSVSKELRKRYATYTAPVSLFDELVYLPDALLYKNDIATMAHSVEGRTPFLDVVVQRFARGLSQSQRFSGGVGKKPLRELLATMLPPELILQQKSGFSVPRELLHDLVRKDYSRAVQLLIDMRVPGVDRAQIEAMSAAGYDAVQRALPGFPFAAVVFARVISQYDVSHD